MKRPTRCPQEPKNHPRQHGPLDAPRLTQPSPKRQNRGWFLLVMPLAAFDLPLSAQQLINVDVNDGLTYSGAAVLGGGNDLWNELGSGGVLNGLVDSQGTLTGVGISVSGKSGIFSDPDAPKSNIPCTTATRGLLG